MRFRRDRKSTRLNSSHLVISYAVFCLKKKNKFKLIHDTQHGRHTSAQCLARYTFPRVSALTHCLHLDLPPSFSFFFFFNDTATTEIYTLSLHDALPISDALHSHLHALEHVGRDAALLQHALDVAEADHEVPQRSEEHTSELQSPCNLVCRLLLEKKKQIQADT